MSVIVEVYTCICIFPAFFIKTKLYVHVYLDSTHPAELPW